MPAAIPVVAAVAGAAASYGAGLALAGTLTGFALSLATGLAGAIASFAISAIGGALFGGQKKQGSTAVQSLSGRSQSIREAASPRRVVIGRVKVGGPLVFVHAKDDAGIPNRLLYLVYALAGHAVQGLDEIYLDDTSLDDPKFKGLVRWEFKAGLPDQVAPQWFIDETEGKWTADHRGRGVTLLYLRLTYDETVFPNGIPNVAPVIFGKKLYDPRIESSNYSPNAVLAVRDYICGDHGLREGNDGTDTDSDIAGANISDEDVPLKAGGTEKRYEAHGVYSLDEQPGDILAKLLSACAGSAIYAGGKWFIEPAAWRPSNRVITESELRGPIAVAHNRPFRDLFNGVRATYVRPAAEWQETDAPVLLDEAARQQDGGEPVYADLTLAFTTSGTMAQRLMQIALRRIRAQRSYSLDLMLHHLALRPGSVVTLDLPRQQRDTIRIGGWTLADDLAGVSVQGEQDNAEIYAWNPETDERPIPDPVFADKPSAAVALTPVLTLTPPTAPNPSSIDASWTAVSGALDYELLWRITPGAAFTTTTQAGTSATISTGGRAEMKVRARKAVGYGEYDVAPFPAVLERFVVAGAPGGFTVEWTGPPKLQVFTNSSDDFATATAQPVLTGGTGGVSIAAGTYYVWARGVEAKGAVGPESAVLTVIAEDPASGGSTGSEAGGGGVGNDGSDAEGGGGSAGQA